jgi:hypothetical protein
MKTQVLRTLRSRNASCMLRGMKRTVALAALILLAMTGTAQAKAPDPKAACKQGGFVGYVDPVTGQPFAGQGQCVSFVAKGGTLVPYVPEPPAPTATIVNSFYQRPADPAGFCLWNVQLAGYPANAAEDVALTWPVPNSPSGVPTTAHFSFVTDATGSSQVTTTGFVIVTGGTVTASTTDPAASDTDTVSC